MAKMKNNPRIKFTYWSDNLTDRIAPTLADMVNTILPSCEKLALTRGSAYNSRPREILVGIEEPHKYGYRVFYGPHSDSVTDYTQKKVDDLSR